MHKAAINADSPITTSAKHIAICKLILFFHDFRKVFYGSEKLLTIVLSSFCWLVYVVDPLLLAQGHAVQSLDLKLTGVIQIRCTSGQVRVQNLCKQIKD